MVGRAHRQSGYLGSASSFARNNFQDLGQVTKVVKTSSSCEEKLSCIGVSKLVCEAPESKEFSFEGQTV